MSRCFPFPPPGYEKKSRVENTDVLSKEKHEEKKDTKDKQEKEKKEGKEKKDKDRSKEKQRDKKDRKDKHKDKEKNRNKEKAHTSDVKGVEGQSGFSVGEKFGSSKLQNNEIKDSKYVKELAKRITGEGKVSGSQMVQKVPATDQRSEARGMATESSSISRQHGGKRKTNDKNEDQRKPNGQQNYTDGRVLEELFDENLSIIYRGGDAGISEQEEKDVENLTDGKEKIKIKETVGKSGKHKDKDREKSRNSKEDREKETKTKEMTLASKDQAKLKEISLNLKHSSPKLNESSSKLKESCPKLKGSDKDFLDFRNGKSTESTKLGSINSADGENPGKRKELEINGFILDKGIRPSKFARTLSSSHPVVENGRKMQLSQTAVHLASEKKASGNNSRADIKEHKLKNGLMAVQQSDIGSTKPLPAKVAVNENGEASERLPHPDLKYLDRILSVPKTEEWPDFIDNEWLFSSSHPQSKKACVHSPGVDDGSRQVWAEALRIESADISALPYVIPY